MEPEKKAMIYRLLKRFIRGFLSTFIASAGIAVQSAEFTAIAEESAIIGLLGGGVLLLDKTLRELRIY